MARRTVRRPVLPSETGNPHLDSGISRGPINADLPWNASVGSRVDPPRDGDPIWKIIAGRSENAKGPATIPIVTELVKRQCVDSTPAQAAPPCGPDKMPVSRRGLDFSAGERDCQFINTKLVPDNLIPCHQRLEGLNPSDPNEESGANCVCVSGRSWVSAY